MDFLGRYQESNEQVAREFLGRKDGVLFYDAIVKKDPSEEVYSIQEYMDVMAYVLLMQQKKVKESRDESFLLRRSLERFII